MSDSRVSSSRRCSTFWQFRSVATAQRANERGSDGSETTTSQPIFQTCATGDISDQYFVDSCSKGYDCLFNVAILPEFLLFISASA